MNIRCPNCQTVFRVDPARVPAAGIRARCSRCAETFFVQRDQDALTGGARATAAAAAAPAPRAPEATSPAARAAQATAAGAAAAGERFPPAAQTAARETVLPRPGSAGDAAATAAAPAERSGWGAPAAAPSTAATAGRPAWSTPPAAQAPAAAAGAAERTAYAAPPTAPPSAAPAAPAAPSFAPPRPPVPAAAPAAPAAEPPRAAETPRPHTFGSRDPDARAMRIARALVSDIIAYHPKRWESSRDAGTLRAEFREEIMKSWEEYVAQVGLELAKSTPHFRTALNEILAQGQQIF